MLYVVQGMAVIMSRQVHTDVAVKCVAVLIFSGGVRSSVENAEDR